MKECPIIFSGEMVRAILDGRKAQTRRIVKPQPDHCHQFPDGGMIPIHPATKKKGPSCSDKHITCPYGVPGDRLWVKETFGIATGHEYDGRVSIAYFADSVVKSFEEPISNRYSRFETITKKRSSYYMPRWASRLTLEITDVRVQRLQEITEEDAEAEGVKQPQEYLSAWSIYGFRAGFEKIWNSLHGPDAWDLNPWVWAISFRPIEEKERVE